MYHNTFGSLFVLIPEYINFNAPKVNIPSERYLTSKNVRVYKCQESKLKANKTLSINTINNLIYMFFTIFGF